MNNFERRLFDGFELRAVGDGAVSKQKRITGYAARFNKRSQNLGGFTETIKPGAFRSYLQSGKDVVALWNHNPDFPLGRLSAKTLRLREDDKGLLMDLDVPDTSYGNDLYTNIRNGSVTGASFGFALNQGDDVWEGPGEWDDDDSDADPEDRRKLHRRTILNFASLVDVSPVSFPAYSSTSIMARAMVFDVPASAPLEARSAIFKEQLFRIENYAPRNRRRELLHTILG